MSTSASVAQRLQLAQETRKRFLADAVRVMVELGAAVQDRLTVLLGEAAPAREMQRRRDAWTYYQSHRTVWVDATCKCWQAALKPALARSKSVLPDALELVGTDVAENKIIASRLVLSILEKVSSELNDLRIRIKLLESSQDLESQDVLRPEVLVLLMIEQWASAGMTRDAWPMVNDVVRKLLTEGLHQAFINANEFLIKQGVLPTIELADRVKRVPSAMPAVGQSGSQGSGRVPGSGQPGRGVVQAGQGQTPALAGRLRGANDTGPNGTSAGPVSRSAGGRRPTTFDMGASMPGHLPGARHSSEHGSVFEKQRSFSSIAASAVARGQAQVVLNQLRRLLLGSANTKFAATVFQAPTPALAAAIAVRSRSVGVDLDSALAAQDYSPAGVVRVASALRRRSSDLKKKAQTKSEKATIEIVALMFQAILQEDRIPSAIRVWFARLQMPVLREALAEPDFFVTIDHPARLLIDRMGSCVMGFDPSGINGSALETEIKRIVQVIEQYPETGKQVYELVYEDFQKFLSKFLIEGATTQKVVSVAQQVEQKETLTIQYTIEMRNMLKEVPVREEIREFLFKVWAEVLAVAAVRKGPQDAQTLELKKAATDLVWAASAKPDRRDRSRVIQALPQLLRQLRAGMTLRGLASSEQEAYIKTVSDTLADAFLSKTQAITSEQIGAMAERLTHLEDFVSADGTGDLSLDAHSIESMLGADALTIDVVADGGSKPSAAMLTLAQELLLGSSFTLDHNGHLSQVRFVWRSERQHLHLFASMDGHSYLLQTGRLAAYLQAGLLLPQEEEALTVWATRDALGKLDANPERLLG